MQSKRTLAGRPGHNRGTTQPPEVLSAEEARAVLRATNKGATGARNRALIAVLYRSGLRLAEALALRPADVDLDAAPSACCTAKVTAPAPSGWTTQPPA